MNEPKFQNEIKIIEKKITEIKNKYIDLYRNYTDKEIMEIVDKKENWNTSLHWKECPNGHIYSIADCGGAMETSKCPSCKSTIGGNNHTLATGNKDFKN